MKFYCKNCGIEFESKARECPACGEIHDISSDEDIPNGRKHNQ